jgi:hypothetical protein
MSRKVQIFREEAINNFQANFSPFQTGQVDTKIALGGPHRPAGGGVKILRPLAPQIACAPQEEQRREDGSLP